MPLFKLSLSITTGKVKISSTKNKGDIVKPMVMHTMTKLDYSFSFSQVNVEGDIILYIHSYIIASKLTVFTFPNDMEAFFVEIYLKGNK